MNITFSSGEVSKLLLNQREVPAVTIFQMNQADVPTMTVSVGSFLDKTVTRECFPRGNHPYTSSTNLPGARSSEEQDSVQVDRGINECNGYSTEHVHIEESQDVSTPTRKRCRIKWRPHYLDVGVRDKRPPLCTACT